MKITENKLRKIISEMIDDEINRIEKENNPKGDVKMSQEDIT